MHTNIQIKKKIYTDRVMTERVIRHTEKQIDRQKDRYNYRTKMTVERDQTKQMTCSSNIPGHGGAWGWS